MLYTPLINDDHMFDTLSFSKKMQKVGMAEPIAEELAYNLRDMHVNQFRSLVTKEDFSKFEKEMRGEFGSIYSEIDKIHTEIDKIHTEIDKIHTEIDKIHYEIENNLVNKKEFDSRIKNLELNMTIKMGLIMSSGVAFLAMLIKF